MAKTNARREGTSRPSAPRKPAQERSRIRYQALLDATAALLAERDLTDVGLYDIAALAKVPPASAYHFFPTKEAAFLALALRFLEDLDRVLETPIESDAIENWPDLLAINFHRGVLFYNENPAFSRILLGGVVISEIRRADVSYVEASSNRFYDLMNRYFVMPYLPEAAVKFSVVISIYDGIWMTSYARHRRITEVFAREAIRAATAYCRSFLPEVLPRRPPAEEGVATRPSRMA